MGEGADLPVAVLFACSRNAARSPMAAAILKHLAGRRVYVDSAGVRAGAPDPFAAAVMAEIGIDLSRHRPKSFGEFTDMSFDLIVSLSPEAHSQGAGAGARPCQSNPPRSDGTCALADDSRIGGKYLRAGLPFGGPCLPRDVKALAALAQHIDLPAGFLDEISGINGAQQRHLAETVCRQLELLGVRSVGILGLSYNDTAPYVIECSPRPTLQSFAAREPVSDQRN